MKAIEAGRRQPFDRAGFAALDLSTGEFRATEFSGENAEKKIKDELEQLRPKELLYASSAPLFDAAGGTARALGPAARAQLDRVGADPGRRLDLRP